MRVPALHQSLLSILIVAACAVAFPAYAATTSNEATVTCKDGSTSKAGKGACSHHGGVAKEAAGAATTSAPPKSEKAAAKVEDEGAMVTCKDGTSSKAGKGACSHHGGVQKDMTPGKSAEAPRAEPATPSPSAASSKAPSGATARCKDGTFSHSKQHSGTCSNHGGVEEWLDNK